MSYTKSAMLKTIYYLDVTTQKYFKFFLHVSHYAKKHKQAEMEERNRADVSCWTKGSVMVL